MRKKFSNNELAIIMASTDRKCHICWKTLCFSNYGRIDAKGCWEVDHSKAVAKGGTNYLQNLKPACITCNRSKGKKSSRSARVHNGYSRAPKSKLKKQKERETNSWAGGLIGGFLGLPFGPGGIIAGAGIGAAIGSSIEVE